MIRTPLQKTCLIFGLMALTTGCWGTGDRPSLGYVTGTITLDGQPMPDVHVVFKPDGARSAFGITNDDGAYELIYLRDIRGCGIGTCRVSLQDTRTEYGRSRGRIPQKYADRSEPLTAEVKGGKQVIDFELSS
ncbi:hypothetical protein Pla175_36180 [Pirellulimonas nuda]|uniref:Carboxypeptidase regulatory-like domain-containing protein n=1 Tax=Pirellulimonas nuda TaxID=2528009 RepID=A0A518DFH8_9BACT|nr:hypothetical protein [Pirellulimonas nuda]QDU90216.1 hypothetical protein Pla175_36180 [Pirellulimonas nuda]